MKQRVFVVQPVPEIILDVLREAAEVSVYPYMDRQISVEELAAATRHADWLFIMHETRVTAEVLNANPGLKGIGSIASIDLFIDMKIANGRKIPIVIGGHPDTSPVWRATADLTMAMLLGLAYRLVDSDRYTRCGNFRQEQTMALMGLGCPGKTVGIIGMGRVAQLMVPRIHPFEMNILYHKRTRLPPARESELKIEWVPELDELMRRSDFVCVLCDYSDNTHKLIGKRQLDLMKPEAYLINTGRGRIIDEPELIRALKHKRIAGAALDVYWNEPYPEDENPPTDPWVPEELRQLDNVILAPHNGGATWDVRGGRGAQVARGMVAIMRGGRAMLYNHEIYTEA